VDELVYIIITHTATVLNMWMVCFRSWWNYWIWWLFGPSRGTRIHGPSSCSYGEPARKAI